MRKSLSIGFFVLIAAYALFQARFLILGPGIAIESPLPESELDAGMILINGRARNISFLSLNDRQIYTDTSGRFEEKLVVQKGINIIKLEGKDRFGRRTVETVRVVAK